MLKINGEIYNLRDEKDRELAHEKVDTIYMEEVYSKEKNGNTELKILHELISDMDDSALIGKWFENRIIIEEYFVDIREYFEDMEIYYEGLPNGDILIEVGTDEFYLTRYEKNKEKHERKGREVRLYEDGKIEEIKGAGLELDKTYYLEKV